MRYIPEHETKSFINNGHKSRKTYYKYTAAVFPRERAVFMLSLERNPRTDILSGMNPIHTSALKDHVPAITVFEGLKIGWVAWLSSYFSSNIPSTHALV